MPQPATILDPEAPLPQFIDSSMLSTFRSCPRKFFWQYVHNLRAPGSSIHLAAGSAFAAGLEAIRNLQAVHADEPIHAEVLWQAAVPAALKAWNDFPLDLMEDSPKNIHNILNALELYLHEFHPYYDEVQPLVITQPDGTKKVTTEFSFAIPLPVLHPNGDPFIYVGRFDLLGQYKVNNLLVVLDDKTTGSLGSYWLKQWDMRGQFLGYLWACRKLGYNVSNVVVRGTGLLKTETNFLSHPLSYPDILIHRWEQELYNSLELIKLYHTQKYYPYNFADACASYGGCPMQSLCQAKEPEDWLNNYVVEKWNPVAED